MFAHTVVPAVLGKIVKYDQTELIDFLDIKSEPVDLNGLENGRERELLAMIRSV